MDVFLSWSGARSKAAAQPLEGWLPLVINAVEPWISAEMDKGTRWDDEISARLEKTKVGVICLTTDNLDEKWIHFEAGALSKSKDAYVCTLLIDIKNPGNVEYPLAKFQATKAEKDDVYRLVKTINKAVERCALNSPKACFHASGLKE
jgi:TIR domain